MFAIAPMMDWTDRHCRAFHRCFSANIRLYTEMLVADAVIHGDRARLLDFSAIEHPVALQLGGADPAKLAQAARIGADWGYDEINLNVGCPSDRVQSGRFGACLMRDPNEVADIVSAMKAAVPDPVPVTVKHRLGVDDDRPEETLPVFVETLAKAGVTSFIVHARKAWLSGLSPKENREIPPLDYALVQQIKRDNPDLTIVLNGGVETAIQAKELLGSVDGIMVGRAAYQNPRLLLDVDPLIFDQPSRFNDPATVLESYFPYITEQLARGIGLHAMSRHFLGLFQGLPGGRHFRRILSMEATQNGAGLSVIRAALDAVAREQARADQRRTVV